MCVTDLASGSSMDWAAGEVGVPLSFSMELRDEGEYGYFLPSHLILPAVCLFYFVYIKEWVMISFLL